jgi:IclR family transcriptional regulator, KDG regulon repressor
MARRTGAARAAAVVRPATAPVADPVASEPKAQKERAGVQSLERAFGLLEAIAQARQGIGLAELSKKVGLHTSTTFHLVKTMVALGHIRQDRDKRYRIGRGLFALAAGALDEVELVSLAIPVLEDLTQATGESGHFAVRSGDSVVVIAKTSGSGAFQLTDRVGVMRPAHGTALGKVLLAALTPDQLERFLHNHELAALTPKTITEPELLRQEIREVARTGVAYDDGEFNAEVRCVAVPVQDFTGQVVGALGISGPIWRLSIPVLQKQTELVKAAARRLALTLGQPPERERARALAESG